MLPQAVRRKRSSSPTITISIEYSSEYQILVQLFNDKWTESWRKPHLLLRQHTSITLIYSYWTMACCTFSLDIARLPMSCRVLFRALLVSLKSSFMCSFHLRSFCIWPVFIFCNWRWIFVFVFPVSSSIILCNWKLSYCFWNDNIILLKILNKCWIT